MHTWVLYLFGNDSERFFSVLFILQVTDVDLVVLARLLLYQSCSRINNSNVDVAAPLAS